jgi:DNA-binding winged helix-turn-helix (wHTH) protein/TolB-like protein
MPSESRACFRFGPFELDARARVLRKEGVKIRLQEQPFQVLLALIEEAGKIVTREDLCRRLWPEGTFVEFDHALNTAIKKIRAALCDDAAVPRYVETIPRQGYRFLALVDRSDMTGTQPARHQSAWALFRGVRMRSARMAVAAVLAITLLGYAKWRISRFHHEITVRLAILPFSDMNRNSGQSSVSAGFAQALAEQLKRTHPKHLAVSAHSLREPDPTANANGEQGRVVDYVVEGGIFEDGLHVHVAVQLVRLRDQNDVWREDFDRELHDGTAAQELAADIVRRLEPTLALLGGDSR